MQLTKYSEVIAKLEESKKLDEAMTPNVDKLLYDFLDGIKKAVEISIAMHSDDIETNPKGGISKSLNYVMDKYKSETTLFTDDMLEIAIKTAFFKSLQENGLEDEGFRKQILKDLKKLKGK